MKKTIEDFIGNTPLVRLQRLPGADKNVLLAKLEGNNPAGSVKDRPAISMIHHAERRRRIKPGDTLIEPTSGNTGIALAMIGRLKGHPVKVVMPDAVSHERIELLEAFGAEIIYSEGALGTNGSVQKAQEIAAEHPEWFMPFQYGNEANVEAHYSGTAAEILEELPEVGAEGLEQPHPLDAGVVGDNRREAVAAYLRHHPERDPGVARRRLEDHLVLRELAARLGALDHGKSDAVLDGAGRVLALELQPQTHAGGRREPRHVDERGVADRVEDRLVLQPGSASGDGRQQRDGVAFAGPGVELVEVADVLVVDVHVHEAMQPTVLTPELPAEVWITSLERPQDLTDRPRAHLDGALVIGEPAEDGWDAYLDAHFSS
jgi:hypothetical protein